MGWQETVLSAETRTLSNVSQESERRTQHCQQDLVTMMIALLHL